MRYRSHLSQQGLIDAMHRKGIERPISLSTLKRIEAQECRASRYDVAVAISETLGVRPEDIGSPP